MVEGLARAALQNGRYFVTNLIRDENGRKVRAVLLNPEVTREPRNWSIKRAPAISPRASTRADGCRPWFSRTRRPSHQRCARWAGTQSTAFEVAKLIEHEQRVIAGAGEVAVIGRALLRAVGRAHAAVDVEHERRPCAV